MRNGLGGPYEVYEGERPHHLSFEEEVDLRVARQGTLPDTFLPLHSFAALRHPTSSITFIPRAPRNAVMHGQRQSFVLLRLPILPPNR